MSGSKKRNMNEPPHTQDVFLSHSARDKAVVRPLAERLRQDGLKEPSRFGLRILDSGFAPPGLSANAFGPDWAQLEAGTLGVDFGPRTSGFGFPLPLRLDDAPSKGSLAQFPYINWRLADREQHHQGGYYDRSHFTSTG
jgi:hypothetical protein